MPLNTSISLFTVCTPQEEFHKWISSGKVAPPGDVPRVLAEAADEWLAEDEDKDCLVALKQGDESALEILQKKYCGKVFSIAVHILEDPGSAEEITSTCFAELYKSRDTLDVDQGIIKLLCLKAKQRSLDVIRKRKRKKSVAVMVDDLENVGFEALVDTSNPRIVAERNELAGIIQAAIIRLSKAQQRIIELRFLAELSLAEIGELLGVSKTTASNYLTDALAALKSFLQADLGQDVVIIEEDL